MKFISSLYLRFVLPFSVVLVLASVLAWWIATSLLTATLEQRLEQQLTHAAQVLAEGGMPFTGGLLARLGQLLEADIMLIQPDGTIGATTLPDAALTPLLRLWQPSRVEPYTQQFSQETGPYALVVRPLPASGDQRYAAVAILASLGDVRAAARRAALWLAGAAVLGLLILAGIGHRIARGITDPVEQLSRMAERIAAGDRNVRVAITQTDEVGTLAGALNAMAERLQTYEQEVAERNRLVALGEMAARVAHEIRNPLTAVKLQAQILSEFLDGERRATALAMLDEIRRLELIVTSTLEFSRARALDLQNTDPARLIEELVELMAPPLAHRGIQLETRLQPAPPVPLDGQRVKQVLLNLLNNAADALPDGGHVRIGLTAEPGGLVIQCDDSGPGIPAEQWADLFTRGASTKPGGFGLGLRLSREIMAAHGGRLTVDASDLGGACFSLHFPRTQAP